MRDFAAGYAAERTWTSNLHRPPGSPLSSGQPLGLVVGAFTPLHRGHVELLALAFAETSHVLALVTSDPSGMWTFDRQRDVLARTITYDLGEDPRRLSIHRATSNADVMLYTAGGRLPSIEVRRVPKRPAFQTVDVRETWAALIDGRGNPMRHLIELHDKLPRESYFALLEGWPRDR